MALLSTENVTGTPAIVCPPAEVAVAFAVMVLAPELSMLVALRSSESCVAVVLVLLGHELEAGLEALPNGGVPASQLLPPPLQPATNATIATTIQPRIMLIPSSLLACRCRGQLPRRSVGITAPPSAPSPPW